MTAKTGSGSVEEYQGKPVSPVINYTFEYSVHDTLTEAKNSEDWPNDSDILKWVNQTAERSAKASAYQKAVADLKAKYEASPEFRQAQFVKSAVAMGFSPDEAEALAKSKIS